MLSFSFRQTIGSYFPIPNSFSQFADSFYILGHNFTLDFSEIGSILHTEFFIRSIPALMNISAHCTSFSTNIDVTKFVIIKFLNL